MLFKPDICTLMAMVPTSFWANLFNFLNLNVQEIVSWLSERAYHKHHSTSISFYFFIGYRRKYQAPQINYTKFTLRIIISLNILDLLAFNWYFLNLFLFYFIFWKIGVILLCIMITVKQLRRNILSIKLRSGFLKHLTAWLFSLNFLSTDAKTMYDYLLAFISKLRKSLRT